MVYDKSQSGNYGKRRVLRRLGSTHYISAGVDALVNKTGKSVLGLEAEGKVKQIPIKNKEEAWRYRLTTNFEKFMHDLEEYLGKDSHALKELTTKEAKQLCAMYKKSGKSFMNWVEKEFPSLVDKL